MCDAVSLTLGLSIASVPIHASNSITHLFITVYITGNGSDG